MATEKRRDKKPLPIYADTYDPSDWRYLRKRSIPATVAGLAYPERVAFLRETFPRLAWVEAYENWNRPDRYGDISERDIADLRAMGPGFVYEAYMLELKREYFLVRWRTWLDARIGSKRPRRWLSKTSLARKKAQKEANEARRRAESEKRAGEREEKRLATVRRRLEALKARKAVDPTYGLTRQQKGITRAGPGRPARGEASERGKKRQCKGDAGGVEQKVED